jgi:hypothetical protein
MGIMDFIKGELIDVVEWTDDSRDTLSYRFPDEDKAIKNNAQLMTLCGEQVRATRFGICRSTRTTRARPSSTSWYRSGC